MRRSISIVFICLVVVMLICLLSACDANKKFVGTWKQDETGETLVLANDGTGSISVSGEYDISGSVTWSVENDKIFLSVSLCGMSETQEYTYKFSGDTMILTNTEGEETVYRKVQ